MRKFNAMYVEQDNMHDYLIEVSKWFGGVFRFQVRAHNKIEALEVAKNSWVYIHEDNLIRDSIHVVRKLKD